eukprot:2133883-Pleurochrysis_carterae.AAC.1
MEEAASSAAWFTAAARRARSRSGVDSVPGLHWSDRGRCAGARSGAGGADGATDWAVVGGQS